MRNLASKWAVIGLIAGAAVGVSQSQDASSLANVSGRVTDSATGKPVLHAHIALYSGSPLRYGALTGADGRYSIGKLPPGQYSASVEAPGFQSSRIASGRSTNALGLRPGEQWNDLDFALTPFGAVSGRVVDADGRPVQGAAISALGPDGFMPEETSDPDGQYRIGSLPPGEYRVRAAPRAVYLPPEVRSDGTSEVHYAQTYFPESLTMESATRIEVRAGVERTATDIRLVRVPIVAVRGKLSGMPPDLNYAAISVNKIEPLRAPGNTMGTIMRLGWASQRVNPDGSFTLWGLDPGRYLLKVQTNGAAWASPAVEVTVASKDVEGVAIALGRPIDIAGQILLEDRAQLRRTPPNASLGQSPQISLTELSVGANASSAFSVVASDGSFHLTGVQPGRYSVRLSWGPFVKSMRLGSNDIDGSTLDLSHGAENTSLTVTASALTAQVSGMVRNASGPVPNARVALLSEEAATRFDPVAVTGYDGGYAFTNLAPGKYRLVALDAGTTSGFAIRSQMGDYTNVADSIELHPGERLTRDLRQRGGAR